MAGFIHSLQSMLKTKYSYIKARGAGFSEQLDQLFAVFKPDGFAVRLVFFGDPSCCEEYKAHLDQIARSVRRYFGNKPPVFSYVAQPPLGGGSLAMEAVEVIPGGPAQLAYGRWDGTPYVTLEAGGIKHLFVSGLRADTPRLGIREQADAIFSRLDEILRIEEMPISSIVRQWNYVEQILAITNRRQHYQEFNDSRSLFYNKTTFGNGYPAATGVGTSCAGVVIDVEALHPLQADVKVIPLNNDLQVPAHAYSPCVLLGDDDRKTGKKTTPKFERGKVVLYGDRGHVYISGTAAIRGEISMKDAGIEEQTRMTLENIEHLISKENLAEAGIEDLTNVSLCSLRIYLKDEYFYKQAKWIVEEQYAGLPAVYLKGDVCREELLVEIEGFATLEKTK